MKNVYEIFDEFESCKTKEEKIHVLRMNSYWALRSVLKGTFDPNVKFIFEQAPEYKKSDSPPGMSQSSLHKELDRVYLFEVNSPNVDPKLTHKRKEQMIKLNVFSDWVQELKTAIGIKLKANEMGSIQKEKTTMKEHWTPWKAEKSIQQGYANVYNAIKKIEIKMIFQMNILRLVMCAKEISQARS